MKQKNVLIYLLGLLLLSGCVNVYAPFDKPEDTDVSNNKFIAQEAINEGDYTEARKKATKVLEISYAGTKNVNGEFLYDLLPENITTEEKIEFVTFNSIIAESFLQENSVDTLSILNTMSSISGGDVKFTDIDVSKDQIEGAKNVYDKAVPDPDELTSSEKQELKSYYQTAGVVYGIYTATKIDEVFKSSFDETNKKVSETNWSEEAGEIIDSFEKAIDYLSISMPEKEEGLMDIVVNMKDKLSKIGEDNTVEDVNNIIKGVE